MSLPGSPEATGEKSRARKIRESVLYRLFFGNRRAKIGIVILAAIAVSIGIGLFSAYSPYDISSNPNLPPSLAHPFGTDFLGHDLYSQVAWGSIPSLFIALVASVGAVVIGMVSGVFAGYFGRLEASLGGMADIIMIIPPLPLLIVIGTMYVPSDLLIASLLILVMWPLVNRAIRNQVRTTKTLEYVEAAKVSGLGDLEIIWKVVIPEVFPIAFAYFILDLSTAILMTTALEFLAVGNPNIVSWGSIIYWAEAYAFSSGAWWWILFPGLYIALVSTSFALISFSVEETLNPRLR